MLKKSAVSSARVSSNGELRIPGKVLDSLGLRPGDPILLIGGAHGLEIINPTLAPNNKMDRVLLKGSKSGSQLAM